jgi:hypothetical protein
VFKLANLSRFFISTNQQSPEYYASIFAQRTKDNASQGGSFYEGTIKEIEESLKSADWVKSDTHRDRPGRDGAVLKTYRAKVGGFFGLVNLSLFSETAPLYGFDPKQTGYGSAAAVSYQERKYYAYSHLILAVNPDGTGFILTVFPGPSVAPQLVSNQVIVHGQPLTKEYLQSLGIKWVKLVHNK